MRHLPEQRMFTTPLKHRHSFALKFRVVTSKNLFHVMASNTLNRWSTSSTTSAERRGARSIKCPCDRNLTLFGLLWETEGNVPWIVSFRHNP
eukprot:1196067-Prorocentrum_minimum.AAC.5